MTTLELPFAFELRVTIGPVAELGQTAQGIRRIIPITGGVFEGDHFRGNVLPGGYDWQTGRQDGVTELEARYVLQTDDGVLITIVNRGLRHGPPAVLEQLLRGEPVDPSHYYFRTAPVFETADARYQWLTRSLFVGTGIREPSCVRVRVFRVS